ncbi:hypothetical protein BC937DRAFT_87233 [Endogone sp. FLAS-F59071]|nr:hypothetical protein BC937DRAFT_87233 [Endogone sp. FLAS-F59071]|eukprot:RUS12695.1 hypothetical protein BC937DRAFT_87233 [Endogone sp. FLAS-F59071]
MAAQTLQQNSWRPIPDSLIDFTSTSFDAILHPLPPSTNDGLSTPTLPELLPFIKSITETCKISVLTILVALIYVKRLQSSLPAGYITEYGTAHRIFVSSVLVASKFLEDDPLTSKKLVDATDGKMWTMKDITRMEIAFLKFLKWDLRVEVEHLKSFLQEHEVEVPELDFSDNSHRAMGPDTAVATDIPLSTNVLPDSVVVADASKISDPATVIDTVVETELAITLNTLSIADNMAAADTEIDTTPSTPSEIAVPTL